jgi:hypothetical protein
VPTADKSDVEAARHTLAEAETAAEIDRYHLRQLKEKIDLLRKVSGPDPADLAILAAALNGGAK